MWRNAKCIEKRLWFLKRKPLLRLSQRQRHLSVRYHTERVVAAILFLYSSLSCVCNTAKLLGQFIVSFRALISIAFFTFGASTESFFFSFRFAFVFWVTAGFLFQNRPAVFDFTYVKKGVPRTNIFFFLSLMDNPLPPSPSWWPVY